MTQASIFKDHFSHNSTDYARFRPTYPTDLYRFLAQSAPSHHLAWDCATGNGQAARGLAPFWHRVVASDGSLQQLHKATDDPRIQFIGARAESPPFATEGLSLITVAQALHWFDQPLFFAEAARTLVPQGLLAVWSYGLFEVQPSIDSLLHTFHRDVVGPFWPSQRFQVDEAYRRVIFPMERVTTPAFAMEAQWTPHHALGYLSTWSAVRRYRLTTGEDPLPLIAADLSNAWGEQPRLVRWPLHLHLRRKR